jgi:predicted unusual protein kinase regulating ubiquinone biosynthesis (AarF/ABC1/UbiB family)
LLNGAQQLASGKRPKVSDLLLTPSNARKITKQLSTMRGAAMKLGQMISMDSGDFLPKELADILAQLRKDAQRMPRAQLDKVLRSEWGEEWEAQFLHFSRLPIAAASIGQVHHAHLPEGERLAIKVQYPGVKESIDSDINNVAGLLRLTGLVPSHLDIKPLIEEGRVQLHQEADYHREAKFLKRFGELLSGDENFEVPEFYPDLSSERILTMSYIESTPIEEMMAAPQKTRDHIARHLMDLVLRELFDFKMMQTDPNFANYRYNQETAKIVLLDFGASRDLPEQVSDSYRNLLRASLSGDVQVSFDAAMQMGFMPEDISQKNKDAIMELIDLAIEPLRHDAVFDFGNNQVALQMREKGLALADERELWHLPPSETVFIQRKLGGMYLLATRLKARVNIRSLLATYLVLD